MDRYDFEPLAIRARRKAQDHKIGAIRQTIKHEILLVAQGGGFSTNINLEISSYEQIGLIMKWLEDEKFNTTYDELTKDLFIDWK